MERRSAALLATAQRAFWPLVKLLLHRGVGFQALAEALKNIFIRVAEAEFALEGKPATDSRISLLTGIHRRDVKRLRDEARARSSRASAPPGDGGIAAVKSEISLSARVIAIWTGLPEHLDADGKPKPLHRLARCRRRAVLRVPRSIRQQGHPAQGPARRMAAPWRGHARRRGPRAPEPRRVHGAQGPGRESLLLRPEHPRPSGGDSTQHHRQRAAVPRAVRVLRPAHASSPSRSSRSWRARKACAPYRCSIGARSS